MAPNALLEGEYERRMNGTVPPAVPDDHNHRISFGRSGRGPLRRSLTDSDGTQAKA
jgi:hypothetical protein